MNTHFAYFIFAAIAAFFVWGCAHIASYSLWGTLFFILIGSPIFAAIVSPVMALLGLLIGLKKTAE
jgi:hypothetical protein